MNKCFFNIPDELLLMEGYKRSTSEPSIFYSGSNSVTMKTSLYTPVSGCLLDQLNNDPQYHEMGKKKMKKIEERKQVIAEGLMAAETKDFFNLEEFWKEAANILNRRIKILDLKRGAKVIQPTSNFNPTLQVYHLLASKQTPDSLRAENFIWCVSIQPELNIPI